MTNPLMTKKTSTPALPITSARPYVKLGAWKTTTPKAANALKYWTEKSLPNAASSCLCNHFSLKGAHKRPCAMDFSQGSGGRHTYSKMQLKAHRKQNWLSQISCPLNRLTSRLRYHGEKPDDERKARFLDEPDAHPAEQDVVRNLHPQTARIQPAHEDGGHQEEAGQAILKDQLGPGGIIDLI